MAFGDWDMPVQYHSVLGEHRAVRNAAAWFDVSHLGRFLWRGTGASAALRQLLSNDVDLMEPGQSQYTLFLNEAGGIVDDLLVWQWDDEFYWVLPNAATHTHIMEAFASGFPNTEIADLRTDTAMIAVQGPEAPAVLEATVGISPKRFRTYRASFEGSEVHLAGTGYSGERGGELVTNPQTAAAIVGALSSMGIPPAGLGARDTLRLEAGLLLAGQDFDANTTPLEAGLDFAVAWDHEFVGRSALEIARDQPARRRLIAFTVEGRRIPRHGFALRAGGSSGTVTSGNYSPILECGIGLGYLSPPSNSDDLEVEIRGTWEPARRAGLPFLKK